MSCHIVTTQEGCKVMCPISSREEYIKVRANEENRRQVNTARMGFKDAKRFLIQMNYSCLPNDDGTLRGAKRVSKTFGMDVDFDNTADLEKHLKEQIEMVLSKKEETGLLMLERSVNKGFHAVFIRDLSLTQEENLRRVSDILGVKFDEGAKDHTRVFYTTTDDPDDLLYLDDQLFDNEAPSLLPPKGNDEAIRTDSPKEALPLRGEAGKGASIQTAYRGTPLLDIATRWLVATGGMPKEGERNTRLFKLGVRMRFITDFKPEVIARNIPKCGLSDDEVLSICKSACSEKRTSSIPKDFQTVLDTMVVADDDVEEEETEDVKMSADGLPPLPSGFKEFVEIAPDKFKKAVIIALLPIWGFLCSKLRARYLDNLIHSPSFQTIVIGEQASGKSFVRRLQEVLLEQVIEEDNEERARLKSWQKFMEKNKNAKTLQEKPSGIIRVISASATNSRLYECMDNAQGLHMITVAEEIDEVTANMGKESLTPVLRNAYDNSICGRDCKTAEATTVMVRFFYNTLFCGTMESVVKFFKGNANDGSVSRQMLVLIKREMGDDMPVWKIMSAKNEQRLQKIVTQAMRLCRDEEGKVMPDCEVDMRYLNTAMKRWLKEQQEKTIREFSKSRDTYKNRAAVDGFRAGMVADWLYRTTTPKMTTKDRQKSVTALARFVADYCVESLIETFPLESEVGADKKKGKKASLFDALSDVFSATDIANIQKDYSVFSSVRDIVYKWKSAGLIDKTGTKTFRKLK